MFRTPLEVRHVVGRDWELTAPLVFEGKTDYFVIRAGFRTDFASIPRLFRWLFESTGYNSEAGVLHDAAWRESKRRVDPRIDPWDADGLFRRALRLSSATALARGLMWFAVRTVAIASGRFGRNGPHLVWKLVQVIGMFAVAVALVGVPTIAVLAGMLVFWLASWIVALIWWVFERVRGFDTHWPWPVGRRPSPPRTEPPPRELLLVIPKQDARGEALTALLGDDVRALADEQLDLVVPGRSTT